MFFASERDKVVRYCGGVFLKEIEDFFHLFFNFVSGRDKVVQHRGGVFQTKLKIFVFILFYFLFFIRT
jgi:hypothetical protein